MSMALLSSSTDGSEFNSSMVGRHSMTSKAAGDAVFSGIEVRIVLHPSLHMLVFVWDYLPSRGFEGGLALGRTQCLLNAIIHSLEVPCYGGSLYISWLICVQYSFAHRLAVC